MTRKLAFILLASLSALASGPSVANAQLADGASKADAERMVQSYLSRWSSNAEVNADLVRRFYAPQVVYYGKAMTRAQVLADKTTYIRAWPVRRYHEVPGTFQAKCNGDRSRCDVSVVMAWHRVARTGRVSNGRARITFTFVPVEGARKIARESARNL